MKKNDIIQAALKEFSTKNYNSASVNNIIKESNTSKGTFYHYFETKEKLYLFLIDMILSDKIDFFNKRAETKKDLNTENIFDLFRIQVEQSIDFCIEYPQYTSFIIQIRSESDKEIKNIVSKKMSTASKEYYYTIIKDNIDKKIIRDDLPIDFTQNILSYLLTNFLEFIKNIDCEISLENREFIKEQYNYYISFIEKGLSTI